MQRRELLKLGLVAPLSGLPGALQAAEVGGLFFTAAELRLLDELTEMVIPADEHSGGARAAGVAAYLDRSLAERDPMIPDHAEERRSWKEGLAAVDEAARESHGRAFLELGPEERLGVLTELARAERDPGTAGQRFFVRLKQGTIGAYYTSRVGIQDEMEYKGNTLLTTFAGTDVSKR